MKKLIYTFAAVILVTFAACDKNDKNISEAVNEQAAFENLLADIDALNSTFQFDLTPVNSTDDVMSAKARLGKGWKIAIADALGAAIGGGLSGGAGAIVGAITASIGMAADDGYSVSYPNGSTPTFGFLDNLTGELHNTIIAEILDDYPTLLEGNFTEHQLMSIICNKAAEHNITFSPENLSSIYDERAKAFISTALAGENFSESMDEAAAIYPEFQNELRIIESYSSNVKNIIATETLLDYTNRVATIVSESNIPAKSQEQITSFVAVYANSHELWSE